MLSNVEQFIVFFQRVCSYIFKHSRIIVICLHTDFEHYVLLLTSLRLVSSIIVPVVRLRFMYVHDLACRAYIYHNYIITIDLLNQM